MKTYVIQWNGPYDDSSIFNVDDGIGLYLITGYKKFERNNSIQYCGITEQNFKTRLTNGHHKSASITREREYWIGRIKSDRPISRFDLELTESLLIYFWQPALNEKKRKNPPEPTVIINRWYSTSGLLRKRIIHEAQKLHDVIYWDLDYWHLSEKLYIFEE